MNKILLSFLLLLLSPALSALDIEETFKGAPRHVLPLLDKNARLDLLDLYNYGMPAEVDNRYNSRTRLLAKSTDSLKLQLTAVSTFTLHLIPGKGDTVIRCIHTLEKPLLQSDTTFYDKKWQKIEK